MLQDYTADTGKQRLCPILCVVYEGFSVFFVTNVSRMNYGVEIVWKIYEM